MVATILRAGGYDGTSDAPFADSDWVREHASSIAVRLAATSITWNGLSPFPPHDAILYHLPVLRSVEQARSVVRADADLKRALAEIDEDGHDLGS